MSLQYWSPIGMMASLRAIGKSLGLPRSGSTKLVGMMTCENGYGSVVTYDGAVQAGVMEDVEVLFTFNTPEEFRAGVQSILTPRLEGTNPTVREFCEWMKRADVDTVLLSNDRSGSAHRNGRVAAKFVGPEDARDKFNRLIEGRRR